MKALYWHTDKQFSFHTFCTILTFSAWNFVFLLCLLFVWAFKKVSCVSPIKFNNILHLNNYVFSVEYESLQNKQEEKRPITICVIKNQIQTQIMFLNMFYSIH